MLLLWIFESLAYCSKVISVIHNMTINNCYQGCYCNQYFHHNYVCAQDNLNISRGQCGHGRGDTSYTAAAISYRSISNSHCSYLPRQEGHLRLPHTLSLMFKSTFFPIMAQTWNFPQSILITQVWSIRGIFPTDSRLPKKLSNHTEPPPVSFIDPTVVASLTPLQPLAVSGAPLAATCRPYYPAPPPSLLPPSRVITRLAWESPGGQFLDLYNGTRTNVEHTHRREVSKIKIFFFEASSIIWSLFTVCCQYTIKAGVDTDFRYNDTYRKSRYQ